MPVIDVPASEFSVQLSRVSILGLVAVVHNEVTTGNGILAGLNAIDLPIGPMMVIFSTIFIIMVALSVDVELSEFDE